MAIHRPGSTLRPAVDVVERITAFRKIDPRMFGLALTASDWIACAAALLPCFVASRFDSPGQDVEGGFVAT